LMTLHTYWDASAIAQSGTREPLHDNEAEILTAAEGLLSDAVCRQMLADVPLGALLSGGVDSSAIAALMQKASSRPIKTFTIGFREQEFDESEYARAVARHLGTDHTELFVTPREMLDTIPQLPEIYDEPFADSSQIPSWAVSKLARTQVTVALSGDGGDELFGGYNRYSLARRSWRSVAWMPHSVRRVLSKSIRRVSQDDWDHLYRRVAPLLPGSLYARAPGDKMHKFAGFLDSASSDTMYRRLVMCWDEPEEIIYSDPINLDEIDPLVHFQNDIALDDLPKMMLLDLQTYLPEDILVKVDRASMAAGLEMRAPFLDHRVIEFTSKLPVRYRVRGSTTKWVLRQILYRHVPRELIERPKTGFGIPLGEWLRNPLKDWAAALLDESRLKREGCFRPLVQKYWRDHLNGERDWKYRLWTILVFQSWKEKWNAQF
jgi:asparagine synthase (glutamine-hydrolysing)